MIIYIIPYLFLLGCSFLLYKLEDLDVPKPLLFFFFLIPAILLVVLRGDVGTDTPNYLQYFKELIDGQETSQKFEPGFKLLANTIVTFGLNERASMTLVSVITILCFIQSFGKTKESILYFAIIVFPCYFFDTTMNGIRYGLSFALATIAIDNLYKNKKLTFAIFSILSISMQYSSILILFVFVLFKLKTRYIILIGLFIASLIPFLAPLIEFLLLKQDAYAGAPSPSIFSGIGPLFSCICLYVTFLFYARKGSYGNAIHLILFLELVSFYIAKISYAGLRFQALFAFTLLIYIKNEINVIRLKREYFFILVFIGLLSLGLWLKNYAGNVEEVEAPYIPYKFFWQ